MHHIEFTAANGDLRHYTYPSSDVSWLFTMIKYLRSRGVQFTHYFID